MKGVSSGAFILPKPRDAPRGSREEGAVRCGAAPIGGLCVATLLICGVGGKPLLDRSVGNWKGKVRATSHTSQGPWTMAM